MPRKPRPPAAARARRLLALLPHLRRGRAFSLAALAETLGTDPAELAADLTTLSMCGLPPYTADVMVELAVENGVVRVFSDPPALSEPARLAPSEARALLAAVQACGLAAEDPLVDKLAALAQPGFSADELARALRASSAGASGTVQGTIAGAIELGEVLEIDYVSGTGEMSCRSIRPFALSTNRGAWYVSAYCEQAADDRTFRLDRIREARPTGHYFEPPARPLPLPLPFEIDELPVAEIRFSADSPGLTEREWPGATFVTGADGSVTGRVPYADPEWVARRVVSYLGAARVVGPDDVRAASYRLADRMYEKAAGELG